MKHILLRPYFILVLRVSNLSFMQLSQFFLTGCSYFLIKRSHEHVRVSKKKNLVNIFEHFLYQHETFLCNEY